MGTLLDFWSKVRPGTDSEPVQGKTEEDLADDRCEAILDDYRQDFYFDRGMAFDRRNDSEVNRCLERRSQKWKASEPETSASDSDGNIFHDLEHGLTALGHGLVWLGRKPQEFWEGIDPQQRNFIKAGALIFLARAGLLGSSDDDFHSKRDGTLRGSFKFRGKDYDVVAYSDGRLSINGQVWKVEGTKTSTEAASIKIDKMDYNEGSETLSVKIKGTLLLVSKYIEKQVSGDQLAQLLEILTTASGPIETPEMKKSGIRLIPSA